jgi:hypothetical protein
VANSYTLYNGNGVQTDFTVSFPYLDQDHVVILVDDVEVPSSWVNATTIRATTAPAAGTGNVKVKRVTPTEALVTFQDGSGLTADDLNTIATQGRYVAEEVQDAFQGDELTNLSVGTSHLQDGAVTSDKIAAGAVITTKLADSNVTTAKIADSNVTTAKIADSNVTTAKIADSNVTTAKIADSNVTTAKIADSNVTTAKIADANVTQAKLQYPAGYTGYIVIRDEKSSGTVGGASVGGAWTKRVLNTEVVDTGSHAALASDVITLQAGTYRVRARASFVQTGTGGAKLRLRNTSDNTTAAIGASIPGNASSNAGDAQLVGRFTIASTKNFELQYWVGTSKATDGLGTAVSSGEVEVYAEIELIRE